MSKSRSSGRGTTPRVPRDEADAFNALPLDARLGSLAGVPTGIDVIDDRTATRSRRELRMDRNIASTAQGVGVVRARVETARPTPCVWEGFF
jgi:hypothetical protein